MKPKLLIVDDDEDIRTQMKWALADDYEVVLAGDRLSAISEFALIEPAVVLLDLGLPPRPSDPDEGFLVLAELVGRSRAVKVIVITGQGEKENALRAVGEGAYDFMNKPIDTDELKVILKRAYYVADLEREYRAVQGRMREDGFEGMLGSSPQMQDLFASIRKLAGTDAPVLILGESGTGKEMAALAIHRQSNRRAGPFVAINCSAIPETLLESELFGHEKGSFTGAHMQRKGRIETAAGGTLLLDEIGELPLPIQVKLLRFLQDQRITRVGGRAEIEVDTRVIAATNANIKQGMADGKFREDLYYRLAVITLRMPPLRERAGDVVMLAKAFLTRFAKEHGKSLSGFSRQAAQAIELYNWPGNVRELENRIKRAVIMADGRQVLPADLELESSGGYHGTSLKEAREALERDLVQRALSRHKGKITAAAEELGISRPTLYELMDKLGLRRDDGHHPSPA